jgi:hypothetical protein
MRLRPGESGRFDARLPDGLASSARASVRGWGGRRPRRGVSLSISLLLRYMIDTGGRVGASNASIQVLESTHMSHPGGGRIYPQQRTHSAPEYPADEHGCAVAFDGALRC